MRRSSIAQPSDLLKHLTDAVITLVACLVDPEALDGPSQSGDAHVADHVGPMALHAAAHWRCPGRRERGHLRGELLDMLDVTRGACFLVADHM